jgi:hypothetical protein
LGREIVYCGDCGTSLREEDFSRGRAREIDHRPYCVACRPAAVETPPALVRNPSSSANHPRVGTTRRSAAPTGSNRGALIGIAAGGLALLALAGALASAPSSRPAPDPAPTPSATAASSRPAAPRPRAQPPAPSPPEPSAPKPDPAASLDRWLADIRRIRERDPDFSKAGDVRALFKMCAEVAGPRAAEVEALRADYERALAAPPPPAPPPAAAAAPKPPAKAPEIVSFTLINAETDQPVPGFDPLPPDALVNLAKLGLRLIDVRVNTSPNTVGCVETILGSAPPRLEKTWPYSCTNNSAAGAYDGFAPSEGKHTVKATAWSAAERKGKKSAPATIAFQVIAK